jgi:hypothetical protein
LSRVDSMPVVHSWSTQRQLMTPLHRSRIPGRRRLCSRGDSFGRLLAPYGEEPLEVVGQSEIEPSPRRRVPGSLLSPRDRTRLRIPLIHGSLFAPNIQR